MVGCSGKIGIITSGKNTCFDALSEFAFSFSEELKRFGFNPVLLVVDTVDRALLDEMINGDYEAFVCFQNTVFSIEVSTEVFLGDLLKAPKFEFIFDPPAIILNLFRPNIDGLTFLYHDRGYINYLKDYYPHVSALLLYPAGGVEGTESKKPSDDDKREYDCSFVGVYHDYRIILKNAVEGMPEWGDIIISFFEYLVENPQKSAEQAIEDFNRDNSLGVGREEMPAFYELLYRSSVDAVKAFYREKCIKILIDSGIKVDVFSETWRKSPLSGNSFLRIHEEINYRESMNVFSASKLSLNLFSWHKASMTERIANIMIGGAVCFSDYSELLPELFDEDKEIALFRLNELTGLPQRVKALLSNTDERISIARAGYEKAFKNHRWINRVEDFVKILHSGC